MRLQAMRIQTNALLLCGLVISSYSVASAIEPRSESVTLKLRTRVEAEKGSGKWEEKQTETALHPRETAIVICDMWDKHWCNQATARCDALAKKMAPLIDAARAAGVHIVHCPSDTMAFYKDAPQRKRILAAPTVKPPVPLDRGCPLVKDREDTLPIDDSDGGCDDEMPSKTYIAWTRQHPAISISEQDVISDNGQEVFNYFAQEHVTTILYMGVHTNMCVLGRSFGIRRMSQAGLNAILVRDLTDTMYNPKKAPFVPHEQGTALVIEHVEKFWCPTVDSEQILKAFGPAGK